MCHLGRQGSNRSDRFPWKRRGSAGWFPRRDNGNSQGGLSPSFQTLTVYLTAAEGQPWPGQCPKPWRPFCVARPRSRQWSRRRRALPQGPEPRRRSTGLVLHDDAWCWARATSSSRCAALNRSTTSALLIVLLLPRPRRRRQGPRVGGRREGGPRLLAAAGLIFRAEAAAESVCSSKTTRLTRCMSGAFSAPQSRGQLMIELPPATRGGILRHAFREVLGAGVGRRAASGTAGAPGCGSHGRTGPLHHPDVLPAPPPLQKRRGHHVLGVVVVPAEPIRVIEHQIPVRVIQRTE